VSQCLRPCDPGPPVVRVRRARRARGDGRHGVIELVSILRYEVGMDTELQPEALLAELNSELLA
jgi:hypothetical protein